MGLTTAMNHHLDFIESNAGAQNLHDTVWEKIMTVHNICQMAFREAEDYLARNTSDSIKRS